MKNEFILAFNEVIEEKQLPKEIILQALESAMVHAYRKSVNASQDQKIIAKIDPESGSVKIFAEKEVVESVQIQWTEVSLEDALKVDPEAELGNLVIVESTPGDFGRVAAQTARQVIQQRIREAERNAQLEYYSKQLGEIISGIVQAANSQGLTVGLEMRAEGSLPRKEMIPGERAHIHDRVRALVAEVKDSNKGPQIILSRTHRDFLRRLLENEVPEIYHGIVEIRSIAREPGERAKVAVSATQGGIDPVGACVGIRGVRIQAIVRELHDEKIDVIEWNPDPVAFIAKAISPARVVGVYLSEKTNKTATVVVPEDQLSLAIGRDGQNARLAAKLTGWRIDIKSLSEAAGDAINKLQTEAALAEIAEAESKTIEHISELLAKKAEGRPLSPEEYDVLAHFTDRVEKKVAIRLEPVVIQKVVLPESELVAQIPEEVSSQNLLDSLLPEHVVNILQENGIITTGDLVMQIKTDKDIVFKLQGIGPRAMESIIRFVDSVVPPVEEVELEETGIEEGAQVTEELPTEAVVLPETAAEIEEVEVVAEVEGTELEVLEPLSPMADASDFEGPVGILTAEASGELVGEDVETPEPALEAAAETADETEKDLSFEELFTLKTSTITPELFSDEEEEVEVLDSSGTKKKKKKKKRKFTEIEYDPDADLTVVRKKHKRGDDGTWEES